MKTLDAIIIIEELENIPVDIQLEAWQNLLDSGTVWKLPGWYGRTAKQLIEQGLIQEK